MSHTRKDIAINLLKAVVTKDAKRVFNASTTLTFFHHNVSFKGDRQSMLDALIENNQLFPNKELMIKHVLAEGDYVTIFSEVKLTETISYATIHLFRFEAHLIAEMWDFGQEMPKTTINQHGMF